VRSAVEIITKNIKMNGCEMSVRMVCIIYGEHQESEIRVSTDKIDKKLDIGPGMVKAGSEDIFFDKSAGILGAWGIQNDTAGEIGLGLIVDGKKLKDMTEFEKDRRLRCDFSDCKLRYWIIGDWKRGRRFPASPTISNWESELRELAGFLRNDVKIKVKSSSIESNFSRTEQVTPAADAIQSKGN